MTRRRPNQSLEPTRPVTARETRDQMLTYAKRGYTVVRHVLVQLPPGSPARASTLAQAVSTRKHRALVLYLFLLANWSWLKEREEPLAAQVWIRALTVEPGEGNGRSLTWTPSSLSTAWADLENLGLVKRKREMRRLRVEPLREDGRKDEYVSPGSIKGDPYEQYFIIPDEFWKKELFAKLSLPALAIFLIISKETNGGKESGIVLTQKNFNDWYGIKQKSVQTGVKELKEMGIIKDIIQRDKAPLEAEGWVTRHRYQLQGEFGTDSRKRLQEEARAATNKTEKEVSD